MNAKAILREKRDGNYWDDFWLKGCMDMYRVTGDPEYRDAVLTTMNAFVSQEDVLLQGNPGDIGFYGNPIVFCLNETEDSRYKNVAGKIREMLRASDLTTPDELYAAQPFIASYDTCFGDKQCYKTIARQFKIAVRGKEDNCPFFLHSIALPVEEKQRPLERVGYMLMALVDTAEKMDMQIYEHYRLLIDLFLEIVRELLPYRKAALFSAEIINADGQPDIAGNIMLVYSLLKGVRLGLLDEEKYLPIALGLADALKDCGAWETEHSGLSLMAQAEIQEVDEQ